MDIPELVGTNSKELYNQAKAFLLSLNCSGKEKADIFEQLANQIFRKTFGAWQASRHDGPDNSFVFLGNAGFAIVITEDGRCFRGHLGQQLKISFSGGGISFTINYSELKDMSL